MAFAGIVLVVNSVLIAFVLPFLIAMIVTSGSGVLMLALPTVSYIRTCWFAIRQHNNQVVNAVNSQQVSALVQREKKAAVDMGIVTFSLFAFVTPNFLNYFIYMQHYLHYLRIYAIVYPWGITLTLITSSVNPLIYFIRNKNLRNAFRSTMNM